MGLSRKVIESRRKQVLGAPGKDSRGAWNDTGERLGAPSDAPQKWSTHGHKISEKASEMQRKHMVEHRDGAKPRAHKRRVIRGGTHGNDYMPPETRGEL